MEISSNGETRQNHIFVHGCQSGQSNYDPRLLLTMLNQSLLKTIDRELYSISIPDAFHQIDAKGICIEQSNQLEKTRLLLD